MNDNKQTTPGIFKSLAAAYTILLLHVLLIAGLAVLVLFFRGIVNYMLWICIGGGILIALSGWLFYRKLKREGRTLGETLRSPVFQGRSVEVSLLGGMATVKLGQPDASHNLIAHDMPGQPKQLESPVSSGFSESTRVDQLAELARLFEKELITPEEYHQAKEQLFEP